jgi:hypothetical protein
VELGGVLDKLMVDVSDYVFAREVDRKDRIQAVIDKTAGAGIWDSSTPIRFKS